MSFLSVMKKIGEDCLKALEEVVKYLPSASALAAVIFPGSTGTISGVVNAVNLIQNAVVTVEQKMAAAGKAAGSGPQKLADVLTIVTPVVTDLLNKEGIHADQQYITNIVNAVVAILNVTQATS